MRWNSISLIGLGLLGGSLAMAVKRRRLAGRIVARVRRDAARIECAKLGITDVVTQDLKEAVEGSELVILCTPLSEMAALAAGIGPFLKKGAVVTDVGSVKGTVVRDLEPLIRQAGAEFVGSHPMSGSEQNGVRAARADMFEKAVCLVTPGRHSSPKAVAVVEAFWKAVGGFPLRMSPETHDELVSRSSHLPHVVAAELANYVLSPAHPQEQAAVCANGFRDGTRVAAGLPEMWRDIVLANRQNLTRVLGVFIEDLKEFQLALERQDEKAVEEFFAKAKQRRDHWETQAKSASLE